MNDYHALPLELPVTDDKRSAVYTKRVLLGVLVLLLIGGSIRVLLNTRDAQALEDYTAETLERTVLITKAKPGELEQALKLPTTLRGNTESVIYARTSGYATAWHKVNCSPPSTHPSKNRNWPKRAPNVNK
jgi:multidrug efflux system membrane fusion protein